VVRLRQLVNYSAAAIRGPRPDMPIVLGGMSPIDAASSTASAEHGALDAVDVLAVHGFPLDWNLWPLEEWPTASTVAPPRVRQARLGHRDRRLLLRQRGGRRLGSAAHRENLAGERVYWYTLLDLDPRREATTRHKQAEGSSYWRHFHFGLLRHDGTPKKALGSSRRSSGICQWFHYGDERRSSSPSAGSSGSASARSGPA
jgi:hypothetical protein